MDSLITESIAAGVYLSILAMIIAFVWCVWLLFIPVTAFSNPQKVDLPWREFLLHDRIVELQVEQVAMSVLVPETI